MMEKTQMVTAKGYVVYQKTVYNGNTVVDKLDDLTIEDIEKLPEVKTVDAAAETK